MQTSFIFHFDQLLDRFSLIIYDWNEFDCGLVLGYVTDDLCFEVIAQNLST